jgi:hypothetical protein
MKIISTKAVTLIDQDYVFRPKPITRPVAAVKIVNRSGNGILTTSTSPSRASSLWQKAVGQAPIPNPVRQPSPY